MTTRQTRHLAAGPGHTGAHPPWPTNGAYRPRRPANDLLESTDRTNQRHYWFLWNIMGSDFRAITLDGKKNRWGDCKSLSTGSIPPPSSSQRRCLYVVIGPDPQSVKWRHHNWIETSETKPHLKPIPQSHLTFSLQLHRISHSLLDWNRFNGNLITFWKFTVPLLQHLLHLLIPVRMSRISLQSNVWICPSRIEASVSGALISSASYSSLHLISSVVRGSSPPFANQQLRLDDPKALKGSPTTCPKLQPQKRIGDDMAPMNRTPKLQATRSIPTSP